MMVVGLGRSEAMLEVFRIQLSGRGLCLAPGWALKQSTRVKKTQWETWGSEIGDHVRGQVPLSAEVLLLGSIL